MDAHSGAPPIRPRSSSSGHTLSHSFVGTSLTDESTAQDESDASPTVRDINRPSSRVRLLSVFGRGGRSAIDNTSVGGSTSNFTTTG